MLDSKLLTNLPCIEEYLQYWGIENRIVWLTGTIDDELYWKVDLILKMQKQQTDRPIWVLIDSPGGQVDIANMFIDIFENSKTPIHTVNLANCHSAASEIFLAGHKLWWNPRATMIIHEGSILLGGSARETKQAQKNMDHLAAIANEFLCRKLNITETELQGWFDREQDHYIYAEDIKRMIPEITIGMPNIWEE